MPLQQPHRADARWNEWRNAKKNALSPGDRWVCVQRVVAAGCGSLGVIDPAAPPTAFLVQSGPKLVRIDLASDSVRCVRVTHGVSRS